MEANSSEIVVLWSLVAAGLGWGASHWWYSRRLRQLEARMDIIDQARTIATQMAQQARRQLEQLQQERSGGMPACAPPAARQAASEASAQGSARPGAAAPAERVALPAHGFVDTMPVCVRPNSPRH